tara:strand:- start:556 stop:1134 length:579 start_codon:yes stop_codon:yes gene_type:complete
MERDAEYEINNQVPGAFVGGGSGIKCKNYELCEGTLDPTHYENHANYLCMNCGDWFKFGFGWNELEFRVGEEECVICNETSDKQLQFPTNCGHWFCVSCSRNILLWDETRYHLSPVPYTCPPCPNGCINPTKGKQCYCIEYDVIQGEWEQQKPDKYKEWNDAEGESIELSENGDGVFGSGKCPLCRRKYERV